MTDVDHAVVESPVIHEFEVEADTPGQSGLTAAHDRRTQQQHALVDQPVPEGLRRDFGAPDAQV